MKKRNRKRKLTRSQKGISLIALTTTILVLAIVTSIVVYNSKNNIMIKQYKKLENDIDVLNNIKEPKYYNEYGAFSEDGKEYVIRVNKENKIVWN